MPNGDVGQLVEIPVLNGHVEGGEAIVIESFDDLAALQGFCATAGSIGRLWENLRFRELRVHFSSLRLEWSANAESYRSIFYSRVGRASLDELSSLEHVRLALDLAEGIWARERAGPRGDKSALALILAVADPGQTLALSSNEPVLAFSSGSPFSFLLLPGVFQATELGVWFVGLCLNLQREEGLAARTIARGLVEDLRERQAREMPPGERDLLQLLRLEAEMSLPEDLSSRQGVLIFVHGLLSTDLGTFDGFIRELDTSYSELRRHLLLVGWPHDTLTAIDSNAKELYQLIDSVFGRSAPNIVFVCHSRGGLVARATAWRLYELHEKYRRILKGCVTFGTPHEGAEPANVDARRLLAYFIAAMAAPGGGRVHQARNFVVRASDMLTYQRQQKDKVIWGIEDLRIPDNGGFIADLQDEELKDTGKEEGRTRSLRLFTIGGRYRGPANAWSTASTKFFGKDVDNDLVVGLHSSVPQSADFKEIVDCSHSSYCTEPLRKSPAMQAALKRIAAWLNEPATGIRR